MQIRLGSSFNIEFLRFFIGREMISWAVFGPTPEIEISFLKKFNSSGD